MSLLALIIVTIASAGISTYIATLPDPTDAQIALASAGATIATTGATTLLGLLDDGDKDDGDKNQEQNEEGDF